MRRLLIFALALAPLQGQRPEVRTTAEDRTGLSVTIYPMTIPHKKPPNT